MTMYNFFSMFFLISIILSETNADSTAHTKMGIQKKITIDEIFSKNPVNKTKNKFPLSIYVFGGGTLPFSRPGGIKEDFTLGENLSLGISIPILNNPRGNQLKLGSHLTYASIKSISESFQSISFINLEGNINYELFNTIYLRMGIGMLFLEYDNARKSIINLPVDVGYILPFTMGSVGYAINFRAYEVLGVPWGGAGTMELLSLSFVIKYN